MDRFAETCERVAARSSRLRKVAILAAYFQQLSDTDLETAVRFLCCGPVAGLPLSEHLFGKQEARTFAVGRAVLRDAALSVTGLEPDLYRMCNSEVGDSGETIALLVRGLSSGESLSLADAQRFYLRLYHTRLTADRVRLLAEALRAYRPATLKYLLKVITGGMRIGLQEKMVEEAVAAATGASLDEVRSANNRLGNLAAVALAARQNRLHTIEARLFHPMQFMLAKPLDDVADLEQPSAFWIEDKYDGIRSQVHVENGKAVIYGRGMDEMTGAFPELAGAFARVSGSVVLDGEVLAWRDGRALAFTVLQQRIARKSVSRDLIDSIPVSFVAYDILLRNGEMVLDRPIEERRALLVDAIEPLPNAVRVSAQYEAASAEEVDRLFEDARIRGNEGLLLKRRGSGYEQGRRSGAWLKMKRPYATLDVVITAAEQGNGKRATMLSDYTFGVRSGDRFVNVGKAYSGLTDVEIRELTRILRGATVERFGRVALVRPEIVLEVAFDGIQKSARHKAGFALRFPRIVRWRKDKRPEESDDLDRVRTLYESSLNLTAARERE